MKISLIALDMDGTFLDDQKRISEENRQVLLECVHRGIEIVPATGRTMLGIQEIADQFPFIRYAITTNGAVVLDTKENKEISTCKLQPDLAVKLMQMARDSDDDIMYDVYIDNIGYTTNEFLSKLDFYIQSPAVAELVRKTRRPVQNHILYVEKTGKEAEKINMFFRTEEARQRMRRELASVPGILVCSSIANNLEINAAGADKGSALMRLADYLGIAHIETMAFGDGENDLSMIQMAGFGVAMENGDDVLKKTANYVTCTNNESGVAHAIRRFCLT